MINERMLDFLWKCPYVIDKIIYQKWTPNLIILQYFSLIFINVQVIYKKLVLLMNW